MSSFCNSFISLSSSGNVLSLLLDKLSSAMNYKIYHASALSQRQESSVSIQKINKADYNLHRALIFLDSFTSGVCETPPKQKSREKEQFL